MKIPEPRKLKSGTWFIQLRLGGVSVPVSAPTKAECKKQAQLIKAEHMAGKKLTRANAKDKTLEMVIDAYISTKKDLSPSTVRGYEIIKRNRFQTVMKKPLSSAKDWQAQYDHEAERLSPKTMSNTWNLVKAACALSDFELPKVNEVRIKRKEHEFLTPDECLRFVKEVHGEKCEIPSLLALCSLRLSEIMALTWADIDLDAERIHVNGAAVMDKDNHLTFKSENKTASSKRYVPILIPALYDALKAAQGNPEDRVVPCMPNTVFRQVTAFLESHHFAPVGVHGLRHSFASLAHHLQIPALETCMIGGWSDYNTVMKIYTHLDKKDTSKYGGHIKQFYENANNIANNPGKVIDFTTLLAK